MQALLSRGRDRQAVLQRFAITVAAVQATIALPAGLLVVAELTRIFHHFGYCP